MLRRSFLSLLAAIPAAAAARPEPRVVLDGVELSGPVKVENVPGIVIQNCSMTASGNAFVMRPATP